MRSTQEKRRRYSDEEFARELEKVANFYAAARLKAVAQTGIREDRLRVLLQVVEHDKGVTFNELLKHMDIQKYRLTRIVNWLCKKRLATVSVNRLAIIIITLLEVEPAWIWGGLSPALDEPVEGPDCIPPSVRSDPLPQGVLFFLGQSVLEAHAVAGDNLRRLVEPIEELTPPDRIGQVAPRLFGRGRGRFIG